MISLNIFSIIWYLVMAAYIQIVLTVIYVVFTEGHLLDPFGLHLNLQNLIIPKSDDDSYTSSSVNDMPINGDIYSYKYKNMYDNYYRNGNGFNKAFDPYFRYPFNRPNFDNMPLVNLENKYPGQFLPPQKINVIGEGNKTPVDKFEKETSIPTTGNNGNKQDNSKNSDKTPDSVNDDSKTTPYIDNQESEESKDKSKKPNDTLPITNEVKDDNSKAGEPKNNVTLNANKDYLLVDKNGNNAYLLHEDIPNIYLPNNNQPGGNNVVYVPVTSNKNIVQQPTNQYYQYPNGQPSLSTNIPLTGNIPTSTVPINNQLSGNNVMYVPVVSNPNNPQQPTNQVYQVVNGQPTSMNIPFTGNGLTSNGYNNGLINSGQSNPLSNNYNPSYIYVYANGQLMQIPGFVINPQQNVPIQNGYNGVLTTSVPNYSIQNGYSPMSFQIPTSNSPVSNNIQQSSIIPQNLQPNNNLGLNNVQNGYVQSNMLPNYNTAGAINNPGSQSTISYPVNSNGNNNQQLSPTPQKEANIVGSPQNNVPATYNSPQTSQVFPDGPAEGKKYIEAQPAIMFSDFKEKDDETEDSKEIDDKDHKEDVKEKKETDV